MNAREEQEEIRSKAGVGKRLLDNKDFGIFVDEIERDIAILYRNLRDEATTCPIIAELQGKLKMLEWVASKPVDWINTNRNMVTPLEEEESEDYKHG